MDQTLKLNGTKADYSVQEVALPAGGFELVIIGTTQTTQNELYSLTGLQKIQFKDGLLNLLTTNLASLNINNKTTNTIKQVAPLDLQEPIQDENITKETNINIWDSPLSRSTGSAKTMEHEAHEYLQQNNTLKSNQVIEPYNTELKFNPNNEQLENKNNISYIPEKTTEALTDQNTDTKNNADASSNSDSSESTVKFNQIFGTIGPDKLIGTSGRNIIDGIRNTELEDFRFFEELIGGPESDIIYFRGFWGDVDLAISLDALINGNGGQNTLQIALDQSTNISLSGGESNQNHLILEAPQGVNTPWDPNFIHWNWLVSDSGEYLLNGAYIESKHNDAKINELETAFNTISSASGTKLNIIRPTSETIEMLVGTSKDDWILGTNQTNFINAGDGNDTVIAKEGTVVQLGSGINTVYSTSHNYTLSYYDSLFGARINLQNNTAIVFDDDMNLWSFDRIMTAPNTVIDSKNNDIIFGNQQNNNFIITGGQDKIFNGGGENSIVLANNPTKDIINIINFKWNDGDKIYFDLQEIIENIDFDYNSISLYHNDINLFNEKTESESAILKLFLSEDLRFITNQDNHSFVELNNFFEGFNLQEFSLTDYIQIF